MTMKARLTNLEKRTPEQETLILFSRSHEEGAELERQNPGKRLIFFIRDGDNDEKNK